jgi:hypothetical protein
MTSVLRFLGLSVACFVAFTAVLGVTGGGLSPGLIAGPPFLWFVLTMGLFGLSGLFLVVAVFKGLQALILRPPADHR